MSGEATNDAVRDERDPLENELSARPALLDGYLRARANAARVLGSEHIESWKSVSRSLYHLNAGPGVLEGLWSFESRALPRIDPATLPVLGEAVAELCRHAGARCAAKAVTGARDRVPHGGDPSEALEWLKLLAQLARRAPEALAPFLGSADMLLSRLALPDLAAWIEDGLRFHVRDRRRRIAYFRLDDPLAHRRLAVHEGRSRLSGHADRLALFARCLFDVELRCEALPAGPDDEAPLTRARLGAGRLLVPEGLQAPAGHEAKAFFEAMTAHAAAHLVFTRERFAIGKLKPLQIALTGLLEDARVERLAAARYPGLMRLWLSFHGVARPARTVQSLFARLSRGLLDPAFEVADGWVVKGRRLFEAAFAEDPHRQTLAREIADILGHDLGQMRIPFDAKAYRVEPSYRDDGIGLFDVPDDAETDPLDLMVEGARMTPEPEEGGSQLGAGEDAGRANASQAETSDLGAVVATLPEWDYRLNAEHPDFVTIRQATMDGGDPARLLTALDESRSVASRIHALLRRARIDRPVRLKRQMEGEEIDMEAVQDLVVSRRLGEVPDPRIYSTKQRRGRDLAVMLLLDTSQSTADPVGDGQKTVLDVASLAIAILGSEMEKLGDPFAVLSFASNGRENVRLGEVKAFDEMVDAMIPRLAGLRPGYSTRLGAAARHAADGLATRHNHRRVLIVVSDGEPSDVDVDDARYLGEDARRAVLNVRDRGLDVFCVALGDAADRAAAPIFGRRNTLAVRRITDLPERLAALYFRLTVS
ncbi:nitric oxide reductase activation protein NorD [Jiella marina]|uniref:nitric oxide reductase activation protein NorD n=1 Tax=Jiella sp. LLJ827 TaxID=2917712 RepID=UPI002101BF8C|nr:VWA domain-containing protein [Jiella sp. LLJ827]MCQ0988045.1 VWA domain-containing protein [Jiella sp. LLJ827]